MLEFHEHELIEILQLGDYQIGLEKLFYLYDMHLDKRTRKTAD